MNTVASLFSFDLILLEAKRAARVLKRGALSRADMLAHCQSLLNARGTEPSLKTFSSMLLTLAADERYYWIGTFYTLLLPDTERRAQAAYFTPPHLARGLVEMARRQGFDPRSHTAIDPAAGGASFLSTIAGAMLEVGAEPSSIVKRMRGYEIDAALAALSESLVANRLGIPVAKSSLVKVQDSLRAHPRARYDLVIANPPYGRVSASDIEGETWREVCHPGHVNKYALFTELCFRLAKPGGLVALVLPSSFLAGPLYGRLRSYVRSMGEVLALSTVTKRDDVFVDVAQDISVLLAQRGEPHQTDKRVAFGSYSTSFQVTSSSVLPRDREGTWISGSGSSAMASGGATLADYGATLRSGYFVWNREKKRMFPEATSKAYVPLIWAKNIRAGSFCKPARRQGDGIDFVYFKEDSQAIVRTNALVVQRTTNSSQPRRLVVARVSPKVIRTWGGFVSENHTIVVTGPDARVLNALGLLLNSAAVDARYRLLSGTASISVTLLRKLDLPKPDCLLAAIAQYGACEKAVEAAYKLSAAMPRVEVAA